MSVHVHYNTSTLGIEFLGYCWSNKVRLNGRIHNGLGKSLGGVVTTAVSIVPDSSVKAEIVVPSPD